ncbi:MAG: glycosyl hydrolase family 8 [Acidimicrobiia bacterium]
MVLVLAALAWSGCGGDDGDAGERDAVAAGERFLDRYVDEDGRVRRIDQGDDTVSEGQAYALLVAVAVDDRARFDLVWAWTEANLRRPDGLLSWHWADGAVSDAQPAADADLDTAWALALAARRWGEPYAGPAADMAAAIVRHEVAVLDGRVVLVAGPWANRDPATVNPSYAGPVAGDVLAEVVGSAGPGQAVDGLVQVVRDLVAEEGVAPDWAEVGADGEATPIEAPGRDGPGRFGWDAVRVPVRLAASCDAEDRAVAGAHWAPLRDGAVADEVAGHAVESVARAAAAAGAGERDEAEDLLDEAEVRDEESPTYFGAALVAVGRLLLETDRLGGCPPLAD